MHKNEIKKLLKKSLSTLPPGPHFVNELVNAKAKYVNDKVSLSMKDIETF